MLRWPNRCFPAVDYRRIPSPIQGRLLPIIPGSLISRKAGSSFATAVSARRPLEQFQRRCIVSLATLSGARSSHLCHTLS